MTQSQLYINGSEVDLSPNTVIALTFQINDIAEVKDRQANYSNQFTLPMTANNKNILESSELINSVTDLPYRKNTALLVQNGVQIIQNGVAIIEQSSDVYEITLYSGNQSFFDAIEGLKLSDLDLSDLDHVWTLDEITDRIAATENILYPIVDYGNALQNERTVDVHYLLPWIYVKTIMSKIFTAAGWTFSGDVLDTDLYNNLIISLPTLNEDEKYLTAKCESTTDQLSDSLGSFGKFANEISDPLEALVAEGSIIQDPGGIYSYYKAHVNGKYSFKAEINYTTAGDTGYFQLMRSGGSSTVFAYGEVPASTTGTLELIAEDVELNADEWVLLFFRDIAGGGDPVQLNTGSTLECTKAEGDIDYGKLFSISNNLPDITQKDFIKSIFQILGIIPQPVPGNTELRLVQFKEIIANKPLALEWTYKIDHQNASAIQYHPSSYSQLNWMRYKEDNDVADELGDGSISIDDETLDAEKDLFILPYAATEMVNKLSGLTIPEYLRIDGSEMKNGSARILILQKQTLVYGAITYTDGATDYENTDDENMAYFIQEGAIDNLGFADNLIANQYGTLVTVLSAYKKLTADVVLNQIDISALDHFIPVYLAQYGNYFYINKIIEWIDGRSAKVELIKI